MVHRRVDFQVNGDAIQFHVQRKTLGGQGRAMPNKCAQSLTNCGCLKGIMSLFLKQCVNSQLILEITKRKSSNFLDHFYVSNDVEIVKTMS